MQDRPAHWLINSQKPNKSRSHQLTKSQTPQLTNSPTQKLHNTKAPQHKSSPTQKLINTKAHQLKNPPTQKLPNTKAHQLKSSPTQKLKSLSFILQYRSNFRSVLAKIWVKKLVKSHYFYPLTPWGLSIFKPKTCILHHLAFLVWLLTRIFSSPNTCF